MSAPSPYQNTKCDAKIAVGDVVQILGLKSERGLTINGKYGLVTAELRKDGRYGVTPVYDAVDEDDEDHKDDDETTALFDESNTVSLKRDKIHVLSKTDKNAVHMRKVVLALQKSLEDAPQSFTDRGVCCARKQKLGWLYELTKGSESGMPTAYEIEYAFSICHEDSERALELLLECKTDLANESNYVGLPSNDRVILLTAIERGIEHICAYVHGCLIRCYLEALA